MENKHEMTEKLKVLENEVYDLKVDLNSISVKLDSAYKYEDELLQRMESARAKTKEMRLQFFAKHQEIMSKHGEMKDVMDVFTGNFRH